MGCYEVQSNFLASVKEELKDEIPSVCNVWDTMDTFDDLYLKEASSKTGSSVTFPKTRTELDRIFGPSTPYSLKFKDIYFEEDDIFDKQKEQKRKGKSGADLVEDHKDDEKINGSNNKQHIIHIKECAKPFNEKLKTTNFKSFRLAPTQLHQIGFKEDSIEWVKTRKKVSNQNIGKQDKVYKSSDSSSQPVGQHKVRYASEKAPP
jgi:hypothetical protein